MDLLGSILDTMEKPPQTTSKQEALMKKQKEALKKLHEQEKDRLKKFRLGIEHKLMTFINDNEAQKIEFEPMEKIHRTVIHDIADRHDLVIFSFGIEGIDRHSVVYKKEFRPTEEELESLQKGDSYDRKLQELREQMMEKASSDKTKRATHAAGSSENAKFSNYKLKYASIIGLDAGQAAAKATTPNLQFGMVPSSNKRDLRSIEQILNDNKQKKLKVRTSSNSQ